jgi:transcriptional regulator with XRE-family HTH domain
MALKAHLEPGTLQLEGRRQPRRALRLETSGVLPGGLEANVTIHNISPAGLLLETGLSLGVGEVLAIDLPQLGPVGAEIVWASERLYGCAFEQALGEAALAAAELRGEIGAGRRPDPDALAARHISAPGDTLGIRLGRLRRERGLTLAQVAAALDVSKPTVWAWEKGKARPLPERIGAIAQVLGVGEADLAENGTRTGEGAALVDECRRRIAAAYGTDPQAIRIMIEV